MPQNDSRTVSASLLRSRVEHSHVPINPYLHRSRAVPSFYNKKYSVPAATSEFKAGFTKANNMSSHCAAAKYTLLTVLPAPWHELQLCRTSVSRIYIVKSSLYLRFQIRVFMLGSCCPQLAAVKVYDACIHH